MLRHDMLVCFFCPESEIMSWMASCQTIHPLKTFVVVWHFDAAEQRTLCSPLFAEIVRAEISAVSGAPAIEIS